MVVTSINLVRLGCRHGELSRFRQYLRHQFISIKMSQRWVRTLSVRQASEPLVCDTQDGISARDKLVESHREKGDMKP